MCMIIKDQRSGDIIMRLSKNKESKTRHRFNLLYQPKIETKVWVVYSGTMK